MVQIKGEKHYKVRVFNRVNPQEFYECPVIFRNKEHALARANWEKQMVDVSRCSVEIWEV